MNEDFKKQIATDFGLEKMSGPEQEKMIERIGNLLFEAVVERAVDAMDETALNEFEDLLGQAGNDYQKVLDFLKSRVGGFAEMVADELGRLKRATSGIFA